MYNARHDRSALEYNSVSSPTCGPPAVATAPCFPVRSPTYGAQLFVTNKVWWGYRAAVRLLPISRDWASCYNRREEGWCQIQGNAATCFTLISRGTSPYMLLLHRFMFRIPT
ncbi:hypothetical protein XENTR_v10010880 [Xenopus tropicalis]|nr:hypothetical protein XENTR_v10010880 [Xenopus tropicalis]